MTPFKRKRVKWDGNDENGRFINKGGFKYDIVKKTAVTKFEDMPKHFLADTAEKATVLYAEYEALLNNFAYSYSISTGLNKADLFGEALIGLARANRDWDRTRSDNFRNYAIFRIKDALNEFVHKNTTSISVPSYIKKANSNIKEITSICDTGSVSWTEIVFEQNIPSELGRSDAIRCAELVGNLINAAERAKVEYQKFIERVMIMPKDIEYQEKVYPEIDRREKEKLEAAIVVEKLKDIMDDDELTICQGIMLEKSYEQIGKEMDKSKGWVSSKLDALRQRILSMMEDGTL